MRFISVVLLLFLYLPSLAQEKLKIAFGDAVYRESELKLGQHIVFDFTETADGKPAFGGKPYSIEYESRDSGDKPTAWRGKVEVAKGKIHDQAVVFAGEESPENISLRVIVENATVYRHNIRIIKSVVPPGPSPYQAVVNAAFAIDKGTADQALANATIYKNVIVGLNGYGKGSDVWNAIDTLYRQSPSLPETRLAISKVLYDTTSKYYDQALNTADKSVFRRVLSDIQRALEFVAVNPPSPVPPGPGPAPVPVGPKKLWVLVIEESGSPSGARGLFFNDRTLDQRIKDKGHKWRWVDKDIKNPDGVTPPDLVPYIEAAKGKQLPYLFLVDTETGKVYHQNPLPATPEKLVEEIGKVGG